MTPVPVFHLDPDLLGAMAEPRRSRALRACQAQVMELPQGHWEADCSRLDCTGFGLLVLSGTLCRRVVQSESYGAELIGPGDLMRPWDLVGQWSTIPVDSNWLVLQPTRLAVLDAGFARRASPYPEVAAALTERALLRSRYLVILIAITSQRRVETRLTMLFWHLADRFGRLAGDWVEIPLPLTHATLAELIGARRPTVTTALSKLQERGILLREPGGWRLSGTVPPELLQVRHEGAQEPALAQAASLST
ncbi:MAG TPA: Crp/Fnr family transcriptional regulator [Solirubrobacterales bacterium]|nr:Crp/Fnr family transcriptional regulator [Solirubrobacterales bacterium]